MLEDQESALEAAGNAAADLLKPGTEWVHRRVQAVRYLEPDLIEVRLSVDFTVPTDSLVPFAPVTMLPKWPPLFRFDYRDPDGHAVPLLTSAENGEIDHGVLLEFTKWAKPDLLNDAEYANGLRSLARGPETHLEDAYEAVRSRLIEVATPERDRLLELAAMLNDCTLLWYPVVERDRGRRQIVKLGYRMTLLDALDSRERMLRSLSWSRSPDEIPLIHIGAEANFHLEVEAPEVLRVAGSVRPRFWRLTVPGADGVRGLRPAQNVEVRGRYAHVYVSGSRPMAADLRVRFSADRGGFVLAAFLAGLVISLFVLAAYLDRQHLGLSVDRDGVIAILLVVPALIGYVVVRPSNPPLVRQHLLGVQLLVMGVAALPVVMAISLVRAGSGGRTLSIIWLCCAGAAWLLTALLGVSVYRSGE